jgi:hypothetical protein
MSRCGNLSVMNRGRSAALIALTVVIAVGACGSNKTGGDAAAGAGGGGSHGGAGGSNAGTGGTSEGTGGSSAGTGGQAGGGGGQQDAGSCRMYGQSCGASQPCCVPMICAGGCVMPVSQDASSDGPKTCSYTDGGALADGGAFRGTCPASGCPAGSVCVVEVGGVAGGGGEYCAPIPTECHGAPSCACMASCVCTNGFGGRPETCSDQNGTIACDNGIR